jgi:hypothetical protein
MPFPKSLVHNQRCNHGVENPRPSEQLLLSEPPVAQIARIVGTSPFWQTLPQIKSCTLTRTFTKRWCGKKAKLSDPEAYREKRDKSV